MSRYTELFQGGSGEFEIKDISGYKKWKESLDNEDDGCSFLLHDSYSKDKKELTVHVGEGDGSKDLYKLNTSINHFSPEDESVLSFWCGLSLYTKEPIDLLQTDEEWPYLTKVFGFNKEGRETDTGMWRVYAFEGKVVIEMLDFKIIKTEKYSAKDLIDEDTLEALQNTTKEYCNKCHTELNLAKFDFKTRGYYEEVKAGTKYTMLCQKCYDELKKPYVEIRKLEGEILEKKQALDKLRGNRGLR